LVVDSRGFAHLSVTVFRGRRSRSRISRRWCRSPAPRTSTTPWVPSA
jgi:hypothetical protein